MTISRFEWETLSEDLIHSPRQMWASVEIVHLNVTYCIALHIAWEISFCGYVLMASMNTHSTCLELMI